MAVFWISECLPLAITSLLPLVLLPLAGVLGTKEVSVHYLGATNMMFVAGLMMAVAVEHCGLHHRIALAILSLVGTSPALIMLGFMACSMFLSMWISNTACTAMMVPIVDAISLAISSTNRDEELEEVERAPRSGPKEKEEDRSKSSEVTRNFLLLSVAYASNIGGTGVITGSPPNLVVLNVLDSAYGEGVSPLTYASWMGFCVPLMVVNTVLAWVWIVLLKKMYTRGQQESNSSDQDGKVKKVIREKRAALGQINSHEIQVLVLFIILIFLWFFQKPKFITGWGDFFKGKASCHQKNCAEQGFRSVSLHPATPAVLIVAVTFLLPRKWSFSSNSERLLDWKTVEKRLPWGVILLLGGGFALADATKQTGLSKYIGHQLVALKDIPIRGVAAIIGVAVTFVTEVASNTATANIVVPILSDISKDLCKHPIYLMMTAAVSCSYAFMLPVATAPNAIVFGASTMRTADMMKAGFVMNIICIATTWVAMNTYGVAMFSLDSYPPWARIDNGAFCAANASLMQTNTLEALVTTELPSPIIG